MSSNAVPRESHSIHIIYHITFKDKKRKKKTLATYREQPVFFEAVGHVSDAVYKSTEKGKHCVSK